MLHSRSDDMLIACSTIFDSVPPLVKMTSCGRAPASRQPVFLLSQAVPAHPAREDAQMRDWTAFRTCWQLPLQPQAAKVLLHYNLDKSGSERCPLPVIQLPDAKVFIATCHNEGYLSICGGSWLVEAGVCGSITDASLPAIWFSLARSTLSLQIMRLRPCYLHHQQFY